MVDYGQKPGPWENFWTFMISGFWHGFYPVYYICFLFCSIVFELAKDVYKAWFLFSFLPPAVRRFAGNRLTFLTCDPWFIVVVS